jgi:DDB1- and CUL4-associated factor 11
MSACQDATLRLYEVGQARLKRFKEIECRDVGWSVVSTDYSPDSRFVIYSTWSPYVHMCNVYGDYNLHEALDFNPTSGRFCLFSIQFSPDNLEILGGSSDEHLYLYDVETKTRTLRLKAHTDDINTVTFVDETANIIASGSDDSLIKVWDRRVLRNSSDNDNLTEKPVGVFSGHMQGITHIDSKGDARYLLSNGKDQVMKLWDMRRMNEFKQVAGVVGSRGGLDYRFAYGRLMRNRQHSNRRTARVEDDTSIMEYRGHAVLETLVRCRFSPLFSTGQRYVYSGSQTGEIFVYDTLTGEVVQQLDGHTANVRDVSWHPFDPLMVSSSWDGTLGVWHYRHSINHDSTDDDSKISQRRRGRGRHGEDPDVKIVMASSSQRQHGMIHDEYSDTSEGDSDYNNAIDDEGDDDDDGDDESDDDDDDVDTDEDEQEAE